MYIGLDFGGTNIRGALMTEDGKVIGRERIKTDSGSSYSEILSNISALVLRLAGDNPVKGMGIGFPGTVSEEGRVIVAPNLGWKDVDFGRDLEQKTGIRTVLDNDVNMAACGEKWKGSAQPYTDFFMLTVGTGVGGAVFLNDRLYGGKGNNAGEIGHINIEHNGLACPCGRRGCLEQYASANALINYTLTKITEYPASTLNDIKKDKLEARHIFDAAKDGDYFASQAVNKMCLYLARGISAVCNLLDPQAVIIGGGVSHAGDFFNERVNSFVRELTLPYTYNKLDVRLAELGDEAGIFGAVYSLKPALQK